MTDTTPTTQDLDPARVEAFAGRLLGDFAGAGTTAMTVLGDRLGLFGALTGAGPVSAGKLAATTGLNPRLVTEWLKAMAVSGYLTVAGDTFELPMEHALTLSVVDSPAYVVGGADIITGFYLRLDRLEQAFRADGALPYADHSEHVFHGIERFFRTAYVNHLAQQ
jgi:hypothetical protein